jgi:small subunit ribosomal protein S7
MPRRRVAERREVLPDPVYNSPLVTKFISGVMWQGKKSVAESIFYDAMRQVGDKTGEEPLKVFKRAIDNVKPTVEVKSRRVGGSTYQVPIEVHQERRGALAIRWIVSYAGKNDDRSPCGRDPRRCQQSRQRREEKGRYASHGGREQGVRALQVVVSNG